MSQETQIKTLDLQNSTCDKCPLSELRGQVVNFSGPFDSKIMFIAEAPGSQEDLEGKPLVGKAGQKFNSILAKIGLHRSQVYTTNTCKCFPRLRTVEGFREPSYDEGQICSSLYLSKEIEFMKPNIIVPMGNIALQAILGDKKARISNYRGIEFWSEKYNCKVIPAYHPSAILRKPSLEEVTVQDFKRAWESSKYPEMTKQESGNYVVLDTIEKFDDFIERMKSVEECALDLETSGLDYQKDQIMCCSFSWAKNTGVLLPITRYTGYQQDKIEIKNKKTRRKGKEEIKPVEVITKETVDRYEPWWGDKQEYVMGKFKELIESNINWILQNGKYDYKFFFQLGWNPTPAAYDTLLMHYLLNETAKGSHNLEDMSLQYLNKGQHKKELDDWFNANGMSDDDDKNYGRVPEELLYKYGVADADVTLQLKQIFLPRIEQEGMLDFLNKLVMPLNHTLTIMEFDGFKIDRVQLNKIKAELQKEMDDKIKDLKELIIKEGITYEVDLDSPKQLSKLLFDTLKLTPVKQTKTGYSTDEEVLRVLAERDKHPIPMKIVEYRETSNILRKYVIGIEERLDKNDRLHSSYHQEATDTGRLGSRNPNLQNIIKDERIKNMFVVDEGNVLVEADEAQGEFRLWGAYSLDPQLLKDLNDGLDIHRFIAALANKLPIEQATDKMRQVAKSIVFGLMFGEGVEDLSKKHNVTVEYAQLIKDTFFDRYPVAKQWRYDNVKRGRRDGFVRSFFGRVRHLPGINSDNNQVSFPDQQAAVNAPIQGCLSDYTTNAANRILIKFKELGLHGKLRNLVHDAIYMEIPIVELEESVKIMKEEMERRILGIQVPMIAEFSVGKKWGSMKKIKQLEELKLVES